MGNRFEIQNTAMNADVESFEVLTRHLSKDKNRIYFEAYAVVNPSFDFSSLYVKNEEFMSSTAFDKNNVYAFSKEFIDDGSYGYNGIITLVEKANPSTFQRTDWEWAKDGTYHFYNNNRIEADFESFEVLNDYFAKDKHRVFSRTKDEFKPIAALVASFRTLDDDLYHGIDEIQIYYKPLFKNENMGLITIPYQDIEDVELLNWSFLRVDKTIFYDGLARTDIDTKTFEIIDESYAKDSKYVYYKGNIVQGADSESFRQKEKSPLYIDKNGTYYDGKLEK